MRSSRISNAARDAACYVPMQVRASWNHRAAAGDFAALRALAALVTALAAVSCGSQNHDDPAPTYAVGGTVTGAGSGLVLQLNGAADLGVAQNGSFAFPVGLAGGTSYLVSVRTAPARPDQRCEIENGAGTVGGADVTNVTVRCVTPLRLLAGKPGGAGNADGPAVQARFFSPRGVAIAASGVVYVADSGNHRIRRIATDGQVSTLAGDGTAGATDGPAATARFNAPTGVTVDTAGNVYVADRGNHSIRRVAPDGTVSTFAGLSETAGTADGTGATARFSGPNDVALDAAGNLYVAEAQNAIRKITPAREVSTLAGIKGTAGFRNGPGAQALFASPNGLGVDSAGNVFVADTLNGGIRRVAPDGTVSSYGTSPPQLTCFRPASPPFCDPADVAVDANGRVWVSESGSNSVRVIATDQTVTVLAGTPSSGGGFADGAGAAARFLGPRGIAFDPAGNALVADADNHLMRRVTPAAVVTTLAGAHPGPGFADGTGSAARFDFPAAVAADSAGNLFVADAGNHVIRRIILASEAVTTFAGAGDVAGSVDGQGGAARFDSPQALATDGTRLWIADSANHTLRVADAGASVTTLAGAAGISGVVDGTGSAARFAFPEGVARDAAGNVYVADWLGHTIRRVTPAGAVTIYAGIADTPGAADGLAGAATFRRPADLAMDAGGNLYVADEGNHTIRRISSAGIVSTLAGLAGSAGFVDGTDARFNIPRGLAVDPSGDVFVADGGNHAVRRITPAGVVSTVAGHPARVGIAEGLLPGSLGSPQAIAVLAGAPLRLAVADSLDNSIVLITP